MIEHGTDPWYLRQVSDDVVERLATLHESCAEAETMGVDIVGDPHRESDEGYNWTRLAYARNVRDVTPGSAVVMGSSIGHYLAKVVAWDFEVSDDIVEVRESHVGELRPVGDAGTHLVCLDAGELVDECLDGPPLGQVSEDQ